VIVNLINAINSISTV